MAGRGWTVAIVLVIAVGVGALAFIVLDQETQETFCTLALPMAPTPPGWNPPVRDAGHALLVPEDADPPGSDPCDFHTDGSEPYAVVRGDDCIIVYPVDWPESARTHFSVEPFGVDGTCWYAIEDE